MQVHFFIYKSDCDFVLPSMFFLSNTPNLKKANETLGGIFLLPSIKMYRNPLHSRCASYKHTNNAALKAILYDKYESRSSKSR